MKKASKKKPTAKKFKKPAKSRRASSSFAEGQVSEGEVERQPQSKEQAAVAHEMFLYTDSGWAQRYFDPNDLHFLEREVFG